MNIFEKESLLENTLLKEDTHEVIAQKRDVVENIVLKRDNINLIILKVEKDLTETGMATKKGQRALKDGPLLLCLYHQ